MTRKKRKKAPASKALVVLDAKAVLSPGAAPLDLIQTMWALYTDWCRISPVMWYTSFGEWMRLVLFEMENPVVSARGREEHRRKQDMARILFPTLLAEYGLTLVDEAALYLQVRPLWKDALDHGLSDNGEGLDGWLGRMIARGDEKSIVGRALHGFKAVKSHLRGVKAGMLGTATRIPEPEFPVWLLAAIKKDSRLSAEIPLSDFASSIERAADEQRRKPKTHDEHIHERSMGIHGWGKF